LHHWASAAVFDYAEASHDGYRRLPQPVTHRRAVAFLKPDYWLIRDELTGEGEHEIDRYLHFGSLDAAVERNTKVVHAKWRGDSRLVVQPVEKDGVEVNVQFGGEHPPGGWLAIGYGKKIPAPVACYRTKSRLPIALNTLLVPSKGRSPVINAKAVPIDGNDSLLGEALVIQAAERRDILFFSAACQENAVELEAHTWLTDARMSGVRLNQQGAVESCFILNGSRLAMDGETLLSADARVPFAVLYFRNGRCVIETQAPESILVSSGLQA